MGGKHGTYVNDARLEKNGVLELPLHKKGEHSIRIGNAPLICKVIIPATELEEKNEAEKSATETLIHVGDGNNNDEKSGETSAAGHDVVKKDDTSNNNNNNIDTDDANVPSTRQSREAQIAAMVASLDSDPVYKKYMPTDEDNNLGVTTGMRNLATDNNNKNNTNNNNNNLHNNSNKNNEYNLPITSSITLAPKSYSFTSSDGTNTPLQSKAAISTLCFEPSGARLVAGHRDGTLRYYDFHGMRPTEENQTQYPPFRIVDSDNDPLDQTGRHVLTALGASASGGQWIVGTTSASPKVLDREGGSTLFHFIKGDSYVTDSSATKGHTAGVTGVAFHPLIKETCFTAGLDGSVRQWDISGRGKLQFGKLICQRVVGKCKNEKGQRTQVVSNVCVHPSGRKLVVGTACGSIQIWNTFGSGLNSRPLGAVYGAHGSSTGNKPVTFVAFSGNGERIASRSEADDTVRIWDVAKMEKGTGSFGRKFGGGTSRGGNGEEQQQHSPSLLLAICKGLPALNESATCAFGPDGRMICAGTDVDPRAVKSGNNKAFGKVKFYKLPEEDKKKNSKENKEGKSKKGKKDKKSSIPHLDPIVELDVAPNASVLGVQWHPKLNQIALGTSDGM